MEYNSIVVINSLGACRLARSSVISPVALVCVLTIPLYDTRSIESKMQYSSIVVINSLGASRLAHSSASHNLPY